MGEQGAVEILYAKETQGLDDRQAQDYLNSKAAQYRREVMNTQLSLRRGYVDAEIRPEQTRDKLVEQLNRLGTRTIIRRAFRRHGNIPL